MNTTISPNRFNDITKGVDDGTIDMSSITMEEWIQVSFLRLFHGNELHTEQRMMYGGNVYQFHCCVTAVNPPSPVAAMEMRN